MASYKLYPQASLDLRSIWEYTELEYGTDKAATYVDALVSAFERIENNPRACRLRNDYQPPVRMCHQRQHVIVYVEQDGLISVLRILHSSMDYEAHMAQELATDSEFE